MVGWRLHPLEQVAVARSGFRMVAASSEIATLAGDKEAVSPRRSDLRACRPLWHIAEASFLLFLLVRI